jgi:hypothetical protein
LREINGMTRFDFELYSRMRKGLPAPEFPDELECRTAPRGLGLASTLGNELDR